LKKQTALRLAQEQTTEPASTEQTQVGRGEQLYPKNHAYSAATTPTVSYPQQHNNQNYPLQQQQNQQQHMTTMTTTTETNYTKPIIHTSSADHGEQRHLFQQEQSSGYVGARTSHDLNYMQPQNQNFIPTGPPPIDTHILVSYYVMHVLNSHYWISLSTFFSRIHTYTNEFAFT
jgi:hypothetical protein